jgi:parallel beta-helix repeat protein
MLISIGYSESPFHPNFIDKKTIYVDDDFIDDPKNHRWNSIQEGINDASNGDIVYVYQGIYSENVILDKSILLTGEKSEYTIIDAQNRGDCLYILSDYANITGFTLRNSGTEIYPQRDAGIDINSCNVTILQCNIISNNQGIFVQKSFNFIAECFINKNEVGVYFKGDNNTVSHCEITNNSIGIGADHVKNNNLSHLQIQNNGQGIHFVTSKNNFIKDSHIFGNQHHGLTLEWLSDNNKISRCNISNNGKDGIHVYASTDGNIISQCQITHNGEDGIEFFDTVNDNIILFCNIIGNHHHGINSHWILTAPSNRMHYCNIYNNGFGIYGDLCQPYAIYNWWGSPDGPSGAGNGQGDEITNSVVYIPWLNEPAGENIPPSVEISSPSERDTVGNQTEIIGLSNDPDGLDDLRVVEIRIDNGEWCLVNGTSSWRYYYTSQDNGVHIVTARAYDFMNYSELFIRTIIADTVPPLVSLLYPLGGESLKGSTTIQWEVSDNQDDALEINLSYSSVDTIDWHTIMISEDDNTTYNWNTSLLPDGKYILRISATDDAGNSAFYTSGNFTIDSTFPSLQIVKPQIGYLYIMDRKVIPTLGGRTLIFGKITVESLIDPVSTIQKVEFYLDDILFDIRYNPPFEFLIDESLLGKHSICVMIHDTANRSAVHIIEPLFLNW